MLEEQGPDDPLLRIDHTGAAGNPAIWFQQDGAVRAFLWWDQVNNRLNLGTPTINPIMSIQDNGNVGVGTTAPDARLDVQGPGDPLLRIDHTGAAGNPAIWFQQDGVVRAFVWWDQVNNRLNLGTPVFNPAVSINNDGTVDFFRTVNKRGGGFKIDHPLDSANKYLSHSFVESPDMKNIYDGVTTLDERGEAVVELPDWFEALNRDFRYQLTAIGGAAPNLHIAEEVASNRFRIAGGRAGMKVSWTLTGIRQDAWANAYRIPVESAKAD